MDRSKSGVVEVDWIISLGIFLIYLTIFFIYIDRLVADTTDASEPLVLGLSKKIRENGTWHVQRVPIFIHSNITSEEPIIADFKLNWKNFSFSDNASYFSKDNKLIFKANIATGTNIKWVVSSNEKYDVADPVTGLDASSNLVSIDSQRFRAEFDGVISSAIHYEKARLSTFNVSIDNSVVSTSSKETNISNLAVQYKVSSATLNHTTFLVGDFARLFNYASPIQGKESHSITVSVTLRNYTNYYFDESLYGTLNFSTGCRNKFLNYIDFYDSSSGVSFITDDTSNISFCAGNNTVSLSITMALKNETNYNILFHRGNYNATLRYIDPYSIKTGIIENLTGLSIPLLNKLNESDPESLKLRWGYPTDKEFTFEIFDSANKLLVNYTPSRPGIVNIFAREFDEIILDKYGNKARGKLRVRGW